MVDRESSGRECKGPAIMAPNGSCDSMQENPQFQQSVLVSTFRCLSAAVGDGFHT